MLRILISERPSELAAARVLAVDLTSPQAHVVSQLAVAGQPNQGSNGPVVSRSPIDVPAFGGTALISTADNYMRDQKQATWLRATKARGVPPRGWPV